MGKGVRVIVEILTASSLCFSARANLFRGSIDRTISKSRSASCVRPRPFRAVPRREYALTYVGSRDRLVVQSTSAAAYLF